MTSEPSAWLPAHGHRLCYWCQSAPRRYGNRCAECAGKGETPAVARPEPPAVSAPVPVAAKAPVGLVLRCVSTVERAPPTPKRRAACARGERPACAWPDCEATAVTGGYCQRDAYRVRIVGEDGDLQALWAQHRCSVRAKVGR